MSATNIILMYHGIIGKDTRVPKLREVGADLYDVKTSHFDLHLQGIQRAGKKASKMEDLSENDVVITFDDGELNNFTEALPILQKYQYPAYFFIIAKRVGAQGYMNVDQLKQLVDAGMIVGSHGLSHEILTNLKDTQVEEELSASKKFLERNLNITVDTMSIPRGFCNDKIIQMAHAAGYKHIFISERPKDLTVQNCHERVAVKRDWTVKRFEQALVGQVPFGEMIRDRAKNITKSVLNESGYNWIRSTYIKMFK